MAIYHFIKEAAWWKLLDIWGLPGTGTAATSSWPYLCSSGGHGLGGCVFGYWKSGQAKAWPAWPLATAMNCHYQLTVMCCNHNCPYATFSCSSNALIFTWGCSLPALLTASYITVLLQHSPPLHMMHKTGLFLQHSPPHMMQWTGSCCWTIGFKLMGAPFTH